MRFLAVAIGLMMLSGTALQSMAQTDRANERLIFLGDSITQAGVGPNGYVTLFRKLLEDQEKHSSMEVIGAGISGNKVPDLQRRLQKDVLDKKPTLVVIYIGINDVWHSQNGKGTSPNDFEDGLKDIIGKINEVGADVILCTPSVIGEKIDGSNPLDEMLEEYSEISRSVAEQTGSNLIDLRVAFMNHLKKHQNEESSGNVLTTDGVHLNQAGNAFVAEQMLKGLREKDVKTTIAKKLRHIVMFQFAEGVTAEEKKAIVDEFGELQNQIDVITGYEHGTSVGPEKQSQGFTHCFVVTFADQAGLQAYLPHPAHQAFVKMLDGKIGKLMVFDYWTD
ncbi:MAG: Dabb family protein [Mariniblastus sp.]|nr:Dabb family protein [Mariniblastus sp.]